VSGVRLMMMGSVYVVCWWW